MTQILSCFKISVMLILQTRRRFYMIKVIAGVEDFLRDKLVKENKGLVDYKMNLM